MEISGSVIGEFSKHFTDSLREADLEQQEEEDDDALSVGSLSDCHTEELESEDEDDDDDDRDDDAEEYADRKNQIVREVIMDPEWDVCNLLKDVKLSGIKRKYGDTDDEKAPRTRETARDKQPQQKTASGSVIPQSARETERYNVHIYAYYRKSRADGGYGIILRDKFRKPLVAYYGFSRGGSYLYYLLVGIKRGLEVATEMRLPRVYLSINSLRAMDLFNTLFNFPLMLNRFCHSKHDAADHTVVCKWCMRRQMCLSSNAACFKQLFPVVADIVKLQNEIEFKYKHCSCTRVRNEAAHYLAKCGAKELEKQMKLGVGFVGVQEVKMVPSEFPEGLKDIVGRDEELFLYV